MNLNKHMHTRFTPLIRALTATSAFCLAAAPHNGFGQVAPTTESTPSTTTTATPAAVEVTNSGAGEEQPLVLSPFVVDAAEEKGSYKANSTLAGTRVRTDLNDVASAISVVTAQFLQDTGARNNQDLLVYTLNTEVAGLNGNFSGAAGNISFQENTLTPQNTTRVRGLSAADNTRDYFLTDIPWDSFNIGRVDIQRGPNSILFGVGSPGGIINNDVNNAEFINSNNIRNIYGSYGSLRDSFDLNRVLIPQQLAIRVSWVNDEEKYQQAYAYNNTTRYYGALRYDPKLFKKGDHTSIQVKFEKGDVSSNNPRTLPPNDLITPWFGLGKPTINEWTRGSDFTSQGPASPGQPYAAEPAFGGVSSSQNPGYGFGGYSSPVLYYNGAENNGHKSATPSYITTAFETTAGGLSAGANVGDYPYYTNLGIASYNLYAVGNNLPGGSYYSNKSLTDPSVFNFFDNLIDGPNKHEWQNWNALNASVSQTFFDDRLGFNLVYDQQKYNNGQTSLLGSSPFIGVDVNATYPDGTQNPNLGRAFTGGGANNDNASFIDRHSVRLTGTVDLRASDFLNKQSWAARILGNHVINGLLEEDNKKEFDESWDQYLTTLEWYQVTDTVGAPEATRQFNYVDYLGPTMSNMSSASGLNLSPISTVLAPGAQSQVWRFNPTWNKPNVNPSDPFTYYNYGANQLTVGTQGDNPANYVGYQYTPVTWLNANNPQDFPSLVTSANRSKFTDISTGFIWQGNMLDGEFVPTFGWRKDKVVSYQTQGPVNSSDNFVSTDFGTDPASRHEAEGETKAWGAVYHFPKFLTSWLPGDTKFSVFFNHNQNFEAEVPRVGLTGVQIPNPVGKTKEYGFAVSTLNDKLTFRVNWYRTLVANDTLSGGLPGPGAYEIWAVPTWGYQYATVLQQGLEGKLPDSNGLWNYGYNDQSLGIAGHSGNTPTFANPNDSDYAQSQTIVNAWVNSTIPASFFNAWGIYPNPINPALAKASGELVSAYGGTPFTPGPNWYSLEVSSSSNNVATTVDTLSRGEEYELSGQPLRNWNITANFARTFATHENIDALTKSVMSELNQFFAGPAGQLRFWGAGGTPISQTWTNDVYNAYLVQLNSQGQSAPEVSRWRFNLITTYNFDRGPLNGCFIGGASRLEAGRIEGYAYSQTLGTLDVTKPWMGPNDEHFDIWFGYQRKIFMKKIDWRIQANLRNVGEKTQLVPSQYEPDGSLALERIEEGMTWEIENSFTF